MEEGFSSMADMRLWLKPRRWASSTCSPSSDRGGSGSNRTPDWLNTDARTGYIGVTTARGELVVDITGAGAGDFVYTLNAAASNTAPADNASLTETFNYDANSADSALKVTIVDDMPTATNITVDVAVKSAYL